MGTRNLKTLALAAVVGTSIGGCKLLDELEYTVVPSPLEMHGDSVKFQVSAVVPEKGLHKKATATITPILKWEGGEKTFEAKEIKGPDAAGNGEVVQKAGKTVKHDVWALYEPGMEKSSLILKAEGTKGKKTVTHETEEVAKGTIITPYLLIGDDKPIVGADNFQRNTMETVNAAIHYTKNNSNVRGGELKDQDIKDMAAFVQSASQDPKQTIKNVGISAYASPEGEITLNDNLANERAASASKAIDRYFTKAGMSTEGGFYNLVGKGEDWAGFKSAMEASDIEDKALILRVLEMYTDLNKREAEIRNLAKTYTQVEKKILPDLRRSMITVNYEQQGKSDAELTALAKTNPDSLNVEELLFSATLANDMDEKLRIYRECSRIYPQDWRGPNNVGYVLLMQGKVAEAKAEFDKAAGIDATPVVHNNLGVCARLSGDRATAADHYSKAGGAGSEVSYNQGIIDVQNGDYNAAVSKMGGEKTFNAALAKCLNGDNDGALSTIDGSPEKDSAMGNYLKAVIAARKGDNGLLMTSLRAACDADASLKAKAKDDLEFLKVRGQSDFQGIVN